MRDIDFECSLSADMVFYVLSVDPDVCFEVYGFEVKQSMRARAAQLLFSI